MGESTALLTQGAPQFELFLKFSLSSLLHKDNTTVEHWKKDGCEELVCNLFFLTSVKKLELINSKWPFAHRLVTSGGCLFFRSG